MQFLNRTAARQLFVVAGAAVIAGVLGGTTALVCDPPYRSIPPFSQYISFPLHFAETRWRVAEPWSSPSHTISSMGNEHLNNYLEYEFVLEQRPQIS